MYTVYIGTVGGCSSADHPRQRPSRPPGTTPVRTHGHYNIIIMLEKKKIKKKHARIVAV